MRKAIYIRLTPILVVALCLGAAACNPKGEKVTAEGDEYSSVFPPVTDDASYASGDMVIKESADNADSLAASS